MSKQLRVGVACVVVLGLIRAVAGCYLINRGSVPDPATVTGKRGGQLSPSVAKGPAMVTLKVGRIEYATSTACQECHVEEYGSWHDSYHRTMTQWASPESVVASFDVTLESRGRSYKLERRGDEFWVTMLEPELDELVNARGIATEQVGNLPVQEQRVVMTTGSHLAQTYWVETKNGIQHMPWMYHIVQQKWIPNEDSFLVPPTDKRFFSKWNGLCAKCHSVGPMPGLESEGFQTRVAELGIACEACHGPAESHIQFHRRGVHTAVAGQGKIVAQDPIVNPSKLSHERSSQISAQCHSSHREANISDWIVNGSKYRPGEDLEQFVTLHRQGTRETAEDYGTGHWGDGTSRTGGDEFLGMIQSSCYQKGDLSCLSCHSLHQYQSTTDQLKPGLDGNESCFQCHESMRAGIAEHTHHDVDSSGGQCANCHMPHVTYALFKGIRSHRIDSPNAEITAQTGRPNACNLCHLDQSLAWTADHLSQWYGQPAVELDDQQHSISNALVTALSGDAAQRVIMAWNLGWESATETAGNDWQAPILAQLLDDPYSVVRYVSFLSLQKMPGFADFEYDFLAPSTERQQATRRALERWRQLGLESVRRENTLLLLDSDGQLRADVVTELRGRKNDSLIVIPE